MNPLHSALETIDQYTNYIFKNEDDFLKTFLVNNIENWELLDVSFSSHFLRVHYIYENGQHVTDEINIGEFNEWVHQT